MIVFSLLCDYKCFPPCVIMSVFTAVCMIVNVFPAVSSKIQDLENAYKLILVTFSSPPPLLSLPSTVTIVLTNEQLLFQWEDWQR